MGKRPTAFDATVFDGASLFDAAEAISERFGRSRITVEYSKLRQRLDAFRADAGWRPATVNSVILSIDPRSEGQQRFEAMLRHSGFEPDVLYYRDAFVSLPPGRSPNDGGPRSPVSVAARVAYIAGLMARYPATQFIVVTHSFELHGPLTDLAQRNAEGKVGLAYFASLLDFRWRLAGLLDGNLGITFFDLDPYGQELVGIDLVGKEHEPGDSRLGLSRF